MKLSAKQWAGTLVDLAREKQGAHLDEATAAFVRLLAERGELGRLPEIVRSVDRVWRQRFGAASVAVESAHPLSEVLKAKVTEAAHGADVSFSVNPALMAGAKVRLDDRVIDNTLSGRAEQLKRELMQAA